MKILIKLRNRRIHSIHGPHATDIYIYIYIDIYYSKWFFFFFIENLAIPKIFLATYSLQTTALYTPSCRPKHRNFVYVYYYYYFFFLSTKYTFNRFRNVFKKWSKKKQHCYNTYYVWQSKKWSNPPEWNNHPHTKKKKTFPPVWFVEC